VLAKNKGGYLKYIQSIFKVKAKKYQGVLLGIYTLAEAKRLEK